jgi:hypothetical protein
MGSYLLTRCALIATLYVVSVVVGGGATSPSIGTSAKYTGPGACSSVSCHGSVQIRSQSSVLQNEYATWTLLDKHAKANTVLANEASKGIGRILGIRPETSTKCLDCHSLSPQPEQQARSFDSHDGISCESCHGPASNWLGPHTTKGWTHPRSIELGMVDIRDPIKCAETCLSCHLGTASKWVDHEMIAAGHPDLYFELDSFLAAMPKHWKWSADDPWVEVRLLTTGAAVQLRENMRRIARETTRFWPEYSELDCFACHHNFSSPKNNWRQERGYAGRRAGNPAWNGSRYAVLKLIVEQVDGDDAQSLERGLARVNSLVSDITADRRQIAAASQAASDLADQIARRMARHRFDSQSALKLMKRISGAGEWVSGQGERAAEQAAMILNSLAIAYCENVKPPSASQAELKTAVTALLRQLNNPAAYNAHQFSIQMNALNSLIR